MYRWPIKKTVGLDLELTSFNRERDRIIQYGIYGVDVDGSVISISAVVDAETDTGREPENIPGVTHRMVRDAVPLREGHLDVIYQVLTDAVVVIHNKHHDWAFVKNEFKRHNRTPPIPIAIVCTLYITKHVIKLPGRHTLSALCNGFRIPLINAHNAWDDAKGAFCLYVLISNYYWEQWTTRTPIIDSSFHVKSKYWFTMSSEFRWLVQHILSKRKLFFSLNS